MPTTKTPAKPDRTDDVSPTIIFGLLSNRRRQRALQYLSRTVGAVAVSELADQIALAEGHHTRDQYERICTSLVHVHVPKLVEAGVLEYDPGRESVELVVSADTLGPYLDLATPADGR